jgi:GNAT superfamily N-acetyltransferase
MTPAPALLVSDLALARRLERTEGAASAAFVEARAEHAPAVRASWIDVDGTYAMFDGVDSPLTQSFGLGLFAPASDAALDTLEGFFRSRGADVHHEVSPMAGSAPLSILPAREYVPVELTTVLYKPLTGVQLADSSPAPGAPVARAIGRDQMDAWVEASAQGWSESPELSNFMREFGAVSAISRGMTCYVAEIAGQIVATGAMSVHGGVALLAGASTIPAWRGRGAQTALLAARLSHAVALGCDLAMLCAAPGSTSQVNGERQGFRVAYTRTKWRQRA